MEFSLRDIRGEQLLQIREELYNQDFLYSSTFQVIGKRFLSYFYGKDIYSMSFENIKDKFINETDVEIINIPREEQAFFQFICYEYLNLEKEPYQCLIKIYEDVSNDLRKICLNIDKCKKEAEDIRKIENKSKGEFISEEDKYKLLMLDFYIERNLNAKEEILIFLTSNDIKTIVYQKVQKQLPYGLSQLLGNLPYSYHYLSERYDVTKYSDISYKFSEVTLDEYRKLYKLDKTDKDKFYEFAETYIESKNIVDKIYKKISSNHCLDRRKNILHSALEAYKNGEELLFINIIPLQIEGIFYDYCIELGIPENKLTSSSLIDKLDRIIKSNSGFYNYEYFAFRFPVIRNRVAHGRIIEEKEIKKLSTVLLLDLYEVCREISSNNLIINKVVELIEEFKEGYQNTNNIVKIAFVVLQELEIPIFYNLEPYIAQIKIEFTKNQFFDYLLELIEFNNPIVNKGIEKIVTVLNKKPEINKESCTRIFKKLQLLKEQENIGYKKFDFSETEFFDQLDQLD
jgi:hypothetical protein